MVLDGDSAAFFRAEMAVRIGRDDRGDSDRLQATIGMASNLLLFSFLPGKYRGVPFGSSAFDF